MRYSYHVMKLLNRAFVYGLAIIGAQALVIERQSLNTALRTFVCQELTWGGCCTAIDDIGDGIGCAQP